MADMKEFADQLQQEVVSDMADSFFGARKEIDNALNAFSGMVKDFLPTVERMFRAAATLRLLLVDDRSANDFAVFLGLEPDALLSGEGAPVNIRKSLPFAWTQSGRYVRCVLAAYDAFQSVVEEYVQGRYYNDPEHPGRKRITMHYNRLVEFARLINDDIRKANENTSTTAVLRGVKGMNPEQVERENILGDVCLTEGCELDKDMCFVPIDFEGYQLPQVVELPPLEEVRDAIRFFCKGLYGERKDEIVRAMAALQGR